MKVTNLDLLPHHTFRIRKMEVDSPTAMKALVHKGSGEAVLVRQQSIKFNPDHILLLPIWKPHDDGTIRFVPTWEQLLALPDPEYVVPKEVSRWAFFTGDNPFLHITSAGSIVPMPDKAGERISHLEVMQQYSEIGQAAIHSKGTAAALRHSMGMTAQVILAGVVALAAIIGAVSMLPTIMERFS